MPSLGHRSRHLSTIETFPHIFRAPGLNMHILGTAKAYFAFSSTHLEMSRPYPRHRLSFTLIHLWCKQFLSKCTADPAAHVEGQTACFPELIFWRKKGQIIKRSYNQPVLLPLLKMETLWVFQQYHFFCLVEGESQRETTADKTYYSRVLSAPQE